MPAGIPSDWSDLTDYIKSALSKQVVPVTQNDGICGFHAREDNFCVEHMFTRFPTRKSTEEGIEDLRCQLGTRKKCFCNPSDRLWCYQITKWQ